MEKKISEVQKQPLQPDKKSPVLFKTIFFVFEISLVVFLLFFWFSSSSMQKSENLWILFIISLPAEFLIAIVPHEPILLYFAKFHMPLTVTLVGIAGTLITEALNYTTFKYIADLNIFKKLKERKSVKKIINLFNKRPFIAICVAGFTPVPFYPIRFLVVLGHYPILKYLLGVFLSRTPRFFILAYFGHVFQIPDSWLVIIFASLLISIYIPVLRNIIKKRIKEKRNAS